MAQLAGLRLRERWAGWAREPFTGESRQHVSIWEKLRRIALRYPGIFGYGVVLGSAALGLRHGLS